MLGVYNKEVHSCYYDAILQELLAAKQRAADA